MASEKAERHGMSARRSTKSSAHHEGAPPLGMFGRFYFLTAWAFQSVFIVCWSFGFFLSLFWWFSVVFLPLTWLPCLAWPSVGQTEACEHRDHWKCRSLRFLQCSSGFLGYTGMEAFGRICRFSHIILTFCIYSNVALLGGGASFFFCRTFTFCIAGQGGLLFGAALLGGFWCCCTLRATQVRVFGGDWWFSLVFCFHSVTPGGPLGGAFSRSIFGLFLSLPWQTVQNNPP